MALSAALAALALAVTAGADGNTCFNFGGGANTRYTPVNDHTVLVSSGLRAYRVTVTPTPLLADPAAVLNVSFPSSSPVICSPQALTLRVSSPSGRSGLIVQSIERLSDRAAEDLRHGAPKIYPKRGG